MPDTPRRLVLRVTLKLLTLTALSIFLYALYSGGDMKGEPATTTPPLQFDLSTLPSAQAQRIEWRGGALQLLRMSPHGAIHLFYDRGGNLGCPLAWQPAGNRHAPEQPWHGGFRDQCSGIWYRYDGKVLPGQGVSHNLQGPYHHLLPGNLLEIGVNGDNAAPAVSQ